uniref:Uncharacterized protein n=1 Tax=Rhizophora mucronata TaxID=61149 RepID=A0A2P2NDK0_RHIMU
MSQNLKNFHFPQSKKK